MWGNRWLVNNPNSVGNWDALVDVSNVLSSQVVVLFSNFRGKEGVAACSLVFHMDSVVIYSPYSEVFAIVIVYKQDIFPYSNHTQA